MIKTAVVLAVLGVCAASELVCDKDEECTDMFNERYKCSVERGKGVCMRRSYAYDGLEVSGMVVLIVISCISSAGGVGAGMMVIPVLVYLLSFDTSDAIHIARVNIFTTSLVNYIINYKKRDKVHKDRLSINYNLSSIIIPLHLCGADTGVIIGNFLPPLFTILLLIVFIIISISKTYKIASDQYLLYSLHHNTTTGDSNDKDSNDNIEKDDNEKEKDKGNNEENDNKMKYEDNDKKEGMKSTITAVDLFNNKDEFYVEKYATIPTSILLSKQYKNIGLMVVSLVVIVTSTLVRGGAGRKSIVGYESCSKKTWEVYYLTQLVCMLISYYSYEVNRPTLEVQSRETMSMGRDRIIRYRLFISSYITGLVSGVCGVGGGILLSVYMISIGMDIHQISSISTMTILYSSLSTSIQSIVIGSIRVRHTYIVSLSSLLGAIVGNAIIKPYIRRTDRSHVILFVLLGILVVSSVVMTMHMVIIFLRHTISYISFNRLC